MIPAFPGDYAGVGVELGVSQGWPRVVRVLPGGAAESAGLRAGDVVAAIGGESTEGAALPDVVAALRGPAGSGVVLTVRRGETTELVPLRRGRLVRAGDGAYRGSR